MKKTSIKLMVAAMTLACAMGVPTFVKESKEKGKNIVALVNEIGYDTMTTGNHEFDGVKVGVFGMAIPETAFKTHPTNIVGYSFEDIVKTAEKTVKILKETLLDHVAFKDVKPNEKIVEAIKQIDEKQGAILNKVIGKTEIKLNGERAEARIGETNLGQLATDAILELLLKLAILQ